MANYQGYMRSSYFLPKDKDALTTWLDLWCAEDLIECWDGEDGAVAFGCCDGVPGQKRDPEDEDGDYIDADFVEELKDHVAPGWGVVVTEVGHEKLRYLIGRTWIVIPTKEVVLIDLQSEVGEQMAAFNGVTFGADVY